MKIRTLIIVSFFGLFFGFWIAGTLTANAAENTQDSEVCVPEVTPAEEVWETVMVEPGEWITYSFMGTWEGEGAPPFPSGQWTGISAHDPHNVGVEGLYSRTNENTGNSDWFYLDWVEPVYEERLVSGGTTEVCDPVVPEEVETPVVEEPVVEPKPEPETTPIVEDASEVKVSETTVKEEVVSSKPVVKDAVENVSSNPGTEPKPISEYDIVEEALPVTEPQPSAQDQPVTKRAVLADTGLSSEASLMLAIFGGVLIIGGLIVIRKVSN